MCLHADVSIRMLEAFLYIFIIHHVDLARHQVNSCPKVVSSDSHRSIHCSCAGIVKFCREELVAGGFNDILWEFGVSEKARVG